MYKKRPTHCIIEAFHTFESCHIWFVFQSYSKVVLFSKMYECMHEKRPTYYMIDMTTYIWYITYIWDVYICICIIYKSFQKYSKYVSFQRLFSTNVWKETYLLYDWRRLRSFSHVTHTNESCHTCMSHVAHTNESCHIYEWVMSHMYESCRTYEWVLSHMWVRMRMSHMWVMSHIWMSHVTYGWVMSHMNESCQVYEWVIPHKWMRQVRL